MSSILLVEDDPASREATCRFLQFQGHTVHPASGPSEALALASETPPSVVICDCNLEQEGDGIELARTIAEAHQSAVILVSGHSPAWINDRTGALQPAACLQKPVSLDALSQVLESVNH